LIPEAERPAQLTEAALREAIENAINERGAIFAYAPDLFKKLQKHNVSIQDLLHICRAWTVLGEARWDDNYDGWRYRIEGINLNGKWMAGVLAVNINPQMIVAFTGYRLSPKRRKP
jgi:hypothetical protein